MVKQSGACVACQQIQFWWEPPYQLRRCRVCGAGLAWPGTREYVVVAIAQDGRVAAAHIRYCARRCRDRCQRDLTRIVADGTARIARELAHRAGQVFPALRFEFDTDAAGRPLDGA